MSFKHEFDLTGVYVVLHDFALSEKYRSPEWRVVKVSGGFGANPRAMGRTIFFDFHDGDSMAGGVGWIDRYATHREIHAFAHRANDTTCVMGTQCPSLEEE